MTPSSSRRPASRRSTSSSGTPSATRSRSARARRTEPPAFLRALAGFVTLVAVFALAVWGVTLLLSREPEPSANGCVARLPDGSVYSLSGEQTRNAALIAAVAAERGMPARAATIGIATAMQESSLINIDYGDRDSLGLFQQRPSQGWGTPEQVQDPVYAADAFYDALEQLENYEAWDINDAAQEIQRSGHPDAYAKHEPLARAFASALTGHSPGDLACDVPPLDDDADVADRLAALPELDVALTPTDLTGPDDVALHAVDGAALFGGGIAEPERAGWAAAHWLVGTAWETGASVVVVDDRMWTAGSTEWTDAGALSQPAGAVLVG